MNKISSTTNSSGSAPNTDSIVFFGSGPVAAKSLELLSKDFRIEAVVTKPQPPHHRGDSPVPSLAKKLGLKTLYAAGKKEVAQLYKVEPCTSRVGVVIDYGVLIPKEVIDSFPLGIINSHFSLLPEWRGADPITYAILSGQAETGVSLMLINEKLDEGLLLARKSYPILPGMTTPELTRELILLSHELLLKVLPDYWNGVIVPHAQDLSRSPTYSRKLAKQDGTIDWRKPAEQIEREIRAFIEWPKSRTTLAGKEVIITQARVGSAEHETEVMEQPGTVHTTDNKELAVQTGKGRLIIERLKPAGKNEMSAAGFISGYFK
jgi:methionyl-tRNA formyltransferase